MMLRSAAPGVKWFLDQLLGDDFVAEYVGTCGAEQYSARYPAINPNHGVPILIKMAVEDDCGSYQTAIPVPCASAPSGSGRH
jgi:hypothetical protein